MQTPLPRQRYTLSRAFWLRVAALPPRVKPPVVKIYGPGDPKPNRNAVGILFVGPRTRQIGLVQGYPRFVWKQKAYTLSRALAGYQLGTPVPAGLEVHHRDGNRVNNSRDNLEIVSHTAHHSLGLSPVKPLRVCLECARPYCCKLLINRNSSYFCTMSCKVRWEHRQRRRWGPAVWRGVRNFTTRFLPPDMGLARGKEAEEWQAAADAVREAYLENR